MGQTEQLAPLFSPSGDSLALASSDGIIRVYDTGTGRLKSSLGQGEGKAGKSGTEHIANGHLVEKNTCLVWATSGRKKKKSTSWSSLLVVGTVSGDVKAFDPLMGELKWRAQGVMEGGVAALAHSIQKPGVVLVAGASGHVTSLSMENGELVETFKASKHAITCLAVSPDGAHAFGGGASLALWQLADQERASKYTGHVVPASCAVFAPNASACASASPGERHVALWATPAATTTTSTSPSDTTTPSKARKGLRPAATTLAMQQPPVQLDTCSLPGSATQGNGTTGAQGNGAGSGSATFCLCAVSEAGEAYVWECGPSGEEEGAGKGSQGAGLQGALLAQVQVGQQTGAGGLSDRILAAKLVPGGAGLSLLVARGSTARPVFETVPVPSVPYSAAPAPNTPPRVVTLAPVTGGALLPGGQQPAGPPAGAPGGGEGQSRAVKRKGADVTVVGPGANVGGAPLMRTAGVAAGAGQGAQGTDEVMADAGEEEEEEDDAPEEALQPLGERVAAMAAAAGVSSAAGGAEAAGEGGLEGPVASDKANSLVVLMTQALRSNDRALLERCLSSNSSHVITNTVARLLPLDAATFLRAAVDRLLSSPARAGQLAPWVKAVLHHHTGYIMSAPGAQAPLAALYQAIDARVSVYSQLLRLHGRLGLVTAHSRSAVTSAVGRPEPEVVFQDMADDEGEGKEGEVEDPFALDGDVEGSDGESEDGSEGSGGDWDEVEDEDDEDLDGDDDDDDE